MNALIHFKAFGTSWGAKAALASILIPSCRAVASVSLESGKVAEQAGQTKPVAAASPEASSQPYEIRVSNNGKLQTVAGRIAYAIRGGEAPILLCTGATSANVAIKSIALSREFLKVDDLDVCLQPSQRRPEDVMVNTPYRLRLQLLVNKGRLAIPGFADANMTVSSRTDPEMLGYALTARIDEGRSVSLTAIGAVAVTNAVLAAAYNRQQLHYLQERTGLRRDIRLAPEFATVKTSRGNEGFSAMRMWVLLDQERLERPEKTRVNEERLERPEKKRAAGVDERVHKE